MISQEIVLEIPYEKASCNTPEKKPILSAMIQASQYLPKKRPAVIVCPGGGYCYTSPRESECIALSYLAAGYQAFVLHYSCKPAVFPMALLELAKAVSVVREHAVEWGIDEDKIIVAGFSAGGHLAASLGCFWHKPFVYETLGLTKEQIKPNGNLLCYPVITSGVYAHRGSFDTLLCGLKEQEALLETVSLEKQVTKENPPTFLWHTYEDQAVPVENSLLYIGALRQAGVSAEFHMYPHGGHGLSLANEETFTVENDQVPPVQSWMLLSIQWIKNL